MYRIARFATCAAPIRSLCLPKSSTIVIRRSISQAPAVKMPSRDAKYTDPELRNEVKEEVQAGDKGGAPGQWSARKVSS